MKNLILIFAFTLSTGSVFSQTDKFTENMKKNVLQIYNAKDIAEMQTAVNNIDRIANAEKNRWEPFYYVGFGYVEMAVREPNATKKDSYLDLAETAVAKATALKKDDSEITALDGFVSMMRITVDPETRGQQYSGLAMQKFGKAVALDANNPRALLLQAQMQFGMARFFGQTPTDACASAVKATAMLEKEQPKEALSPTWGKGMAAKLNGDCK